MSTPHNGRLTYAYAVLHRDARPPAGLLGIGNAPVRTVAEGPLAALVSDVPAAEFDQPGVRDRLEDLTWLEATARAHRRVVDETAAAVGVLPLRLVTVYRDEDAVRAALAEHAERFERLLNRLAGRLEWGVKAYAQQAPEDRKSKDPEPDDRKPSEAESGREFLRRRLRDRKAGDAALHEADGLARAVHDTLARAAEHSRLHRPQDGRLAEAVAASGAPDAAGRAPAGTRPAVSRGPNLLNGAYLVRREAAGTFAERVGELAARSPALRIELTGPWAPYSFTDLADTDDEAGRTTS
ncbi:GvpL/GvpF family gas vesicle protein [Streptomyces sp. NPDC053542]|uniref:GvpL/GvpF family gas vesicle protein n=1 Tax=Streptomyces sp. NPDC053542 TaxID=3365710 RepID=UPI0037D82C73